jgi:type IV pilus assembly protein PilY1
MNKQTFPLILRRAAIGAGAALLAGGPFAVALATAPPLVPISQVPMTVQIPAHPQILLAVGNSQSMDGDLSGRIYTGSGALPSTMSVLNASSSPVSYTIPSGFTPPANPGSSGVAPYTVNTGGVLYDNSASRLNVAKGGIKSILNNYMADADFALMDYQISNSTSNLYMWTTWVYQMSPAGGFLFTNNPTPPAGDEIVANPCFGVIITGSPAAHTPQYDCQVLSNYYATVQVPHQTNITSKAYMLLSASSDDPLINDVLYQGAPYGMSDPVCMVTGGPTPASPFSYSLNTYNTNIGGVLETYSTEYPSGTCANQTGPTNAGFVPYSTQVMYEERGFGYYSFSETANNGTMLVPMKTAGQTPTTTSVNNAIGWFTPYLLEETNQQGSTEIKAEATQSPIAGLLKGAYNYFKTNPSTSNGCRASQYVVLMTDGLPTLDLSNHTWPPLGSAAATGYGVNASFNYVPGTSSSPSTWSLGTTNDQALTDVMTEIAALQSIQVNVYIIGVGAGVDASVNMSAYQTLDAMAYAGGTKASFPANSPAAVTADLQIIITSILAATQSTASAAVNSTGLNTSSVVYQSQFTTSDVFQDWTGNLFAFPINPTTGAVNTTPTVPPALWSAQTQLDGQTWSLGRLIATWDPVASAGTPFQWNTGTPTTGIATSTQLGIDLETFTSDGNGQDMLQFLRGSNAQEVRNGGQFRNRTHKLGDIVSSDPLYIGPPSSNNQSASYVAFAQTYASRPPMIYVGANDGMLHAFSAATGNEMFAYIPTGVFANLPMLANPYYNAVHQFYVNGSPQASDVQFTDNTWHTILVGTEAQGGSSVYALDVTNPAAITTENVLASDVLWDFTDPDMGLGFSTPALSNTADGWQVFFGNGYNSRFGKPFLYAVNPQNGSTTVKIDLCAAVPTACNLTVANGLSTVIAVNSSGQLSQYSNLVYAGDLQGNLWRINIANSNPLLWTVSVMFQARDSSGNMQNITTSPVATLNPRYPAVLGTMVYFVTGQLLGTPDLATSQVQTIYGIFDPATGYSTPLNRTSAAMEHEPLSYAYSNSAAYIVTGTALTIPSQEGWYIDLNLPACSGCTPSQPAHTGERGVTDPRMESGGALVLTTYQPNSNVCTVGGNSYLYVLNYAGGSFTSPQFDINNSGTITSADTATNSTGATVYPVGMGLGAVFAAAPTIRTANMTTAGAVKLITRSDGTIQTVVEKGNSKSRTAWWEVHQ